MSIWLMYCLPVVMDVYVDKTLTSHALPPAQGRIGSSLHQTVSGLAVVTVHQVQLTVCAAQNWVSHKLDLFNKLKRTDRQLHCSDPLIQRYTDCLHQQKQEQPPVPTTFHPITSESRQLASHHTFIHLRHAATFFCRLFLLKFVFVFLV